MSPVARRHVFWSGLEAGASGLFSFISTCVVARLIGAAELGLAAAVVATHVLLWVAVNGLFADALVQRAGTSPSIAADAGSALFASALWASAIAGAGAAPLQLAAGWLLGRCFDDARLLPMSALLALALPLVGAAGARQGQATLRRDYRLLAWRTIAGQGLGTAAGILAAMLHAGAWAPVVQQGTVSFAGAAVLLVGLRVRSRPDWRTVRSLLRIGVPLTASTLALAGRYRVFALLIGGTAGPATLGQVHMAFRLVDTVRELAATAQWRLMLPVLSERQHDSGAMLAACDRLLALSSIALLPLCAAMALTLPRLVHAVLGPGWAEAGIAAGPLVGLMALATLMFPSGVALVARGETGPVLAGNCCMLGLTLLGALVLQPATPLAAVLVWSAAQIAVTPYLLRMAGHAIRATPLRPLRTGVPVLGASIGAALGVLLLLHATGEPASPLWSALLRVALLGALLGAAAAAGYDPAYGFCVPRNWMRIGVPGRPNVSRNPFAR
jgi:PST family polysaccharide transporter